MKNQFYFRSENADITFNVWAITLVQAISKAQLILPNASDLKLVK